MMDEVVGHMTEKVVIPAPEDIEIEPRRYTTLPPEEFHAYKPGADLSPTCREWARATTFTSPD